MFSMGYDQKHFCYGRGHGFKPTSHRSCRTVEHQELLRAK
jgi:hypothetical protein